MDYTCLQPDSPSPRVNLPWSRLSGLSGWYSWRSLLPVNAEAKKAFRVTLSPSLSFFISACLIIITCSHLCFPTLVPTCLFLSMKLTSLSLPVPVSTFFWNRSALFFDHSSRITSVVPLEVLICIWIFRVKRNNCYICIHEILRWGAFWHHLPNCVFELPKFIFPVRAFQVVTFLQIFPSSGPMLIVLVTDIHLTSPMTYIWFSSLRVCPNRLSY